MYTTLCVNCDDIMHYLLVQARALDRVHSEFNTLEVALRKRLSEVTTLIEEEVMPHL